MWDFRIYNNCGVHEHSYKESFELTKKRHLRKFNELVSKNKVTQSATNITYKKKWIINMSSRPILKPIFSQRALTSQLLQKHYQIKIL